MSFVNQNNSATFANFTNPTSPTSIYTSDYIGYATSGALVIFVNSFTLAILLSNRILFRQSALIVGITLGNCLLGLNLFTTGVYRLVIPYLQKLATLENCVSTIIPLIYPLAFNMEASFFFLAGLERFLAVTKPNWYSQKWTVKYSWSLMGINCVFVLVTLIVGLIWAKYDHSPLTWSCPIPFMYPHNYATFLSGFSAFGGASSAFLTIIALIAGIRHLRKLPVTASNDKRRYQKQLQLTKSMTTMSCFDLILVAIPNFLTFLISLGISLPEFMRPWNTNYTNATNAMMTFFILMVFNEKFKKAAIILFHLKKVTWMWNKIVSKLIVKTRHEVHANVAVSRVHRFSSTHF